MKIFITGGASGLGAAVTRQLASRPENQVFFTYNSSFAESENIQKEFPNTFPLKCNFKEESEVNNLCKQIEEISPDVLINNAYTGTFIDTYFHKTDSGEFLETFKNNILPTIVISQAAINVFRKKKSGKLITVLTAALEGNPPLGTSVYVAGKAYLEKLTKVWAIENEKFNITSNAVSPGFMLTSFTKSIDERMIEQIRENQPGKKLLEPIEVAKKIEFLCSAGNELNGENIIVNAGASAT